MSFVYREAATVLAGFLSGSGGIKSLAYAAEIKQKKAVYALVLNTLKCTAQTFPILPLCESADHMM